MSEPFIRNLPVPYYSQRENTFIWHSLYIKDFIDKKGHLHQKGTIRNEEKGISLAGSSCNVTCLAMLLNYSGISSDTPDRIMEKFFIPPVPYDSEEMADLRDKAISAKGYECIQNYKNLEKIIRNIYFREALTSLREKDMGFVKEQISQGFPVMVNCGIARKYREDSWCREQMEKESEKGNIEETYEDLYKTRYQTDLQNTRKAISDAATDEEKTEARNRLNLVNQHYIKAKARRLETLKEERYKGHFIIIRGFTEDSVIINDPWGDPTDKNGRIPADGSGEYTSPFGDGIRVKHEDFRKQYGETFRITFVLHGNRWNFIFHSPSLIPAGAKATEDMLRACLALETFDHGGYPMKRSNLWHNGIHLKSHKGQMVYPVGPGQIVAARVVNENTADSSDTAPANGSRCFVLVKHQIHNDEGLADFYSLYMHLKPIQNLEPIQEEYPEKKTGIHWIDNLLSLSVHQARVLRNVKVYKKNGTVLKTENGTPCRLARNSLLIFKQNHDNKLFYDFSDDRGVRYEDCWSFKKKTDAAGKTLWNFGSTPLYADNSAYMKKYRQKIRELSEGNITYFHDLPDPFIEVTSLTALGTSGTFSGADGKDETLIHLEIFSDDVLIPDFASQAFRLISYQDNPAGLCNCREMIELFDKNGLYENWLDRLLHFGDGVITKSEMKSYYRENQNHFRNYICQHKSEWSDQTDWKSELEKAVGIPRKGLALPFLKSKGDVFQNTLEDYVKHIYDPYKWFTSEALKAMNPSSRKLLSKGAATFYHPVEFIGWLTTHDDRATAMLRNEDAG